MHTSLVDLSSRVQEEIKMLIRIALALSLSLAFSAAAFAQKPVVKGKPGQKGEAPFDLYAGVEFKIYDYHQMPFTPTVTIQQSEGYRSGSVEAASQDLVGLFENYLPIGDESLTYHKTTFIKETSYLKIPLTKKLLFGSHSEVPVVRVSVEQIACAAGEKGFRLKTAAVPGIKLYKPDALRSASLEVCYRETDREVIIRFVGKMIPGTQAERYGSHVVVGMLTPLVSKLRSQILVHSAGR
jgi:hypothetical protein